MVDGFLLFTILDVWRMVLSLGLTLIVCVTGAINKWEGSSYYAGICDVLSFLVFRLTVCFMIIAGVVGILVPAILGYSVPESHLAVGPWSYEEILGFVLGVLCLWRSRSLAIGDRRFRLGWFNCAAVMFLGIGVLWIGRWDAMANGGNIPGGWFLLELSHLEWTRVIPKFFHLLFSSLAAGGLLLTLLGLIRWFEGTASPISVSPFQSLPSFEVIRYGVGWILSGLIPQMLIGPWLFLMLGEGARGSLIDGGGLVSVLFFGSVTAALMALVLLNASFMVPHVKGLVWGGLISVGLTLVLMGIIRYEVFLATLQGHGVPIAIEGVTPIHLLTVLILTGLLGVILIRWCVRPIVALHPNSLSTQRLDKRFSAN